MKILILEPDESTRSVLLQRVQVAVRQAGIRRHSIVDGDFDLLLEGSAKDEPAVVFFGPGTYQKVDQSLSVVRGHFPRVPIALVLDNQTYAKEAVELRKGAAVRVMPIADIAQMVQFLLDCESDTKEQPDARSRGVVSVVQTKGGVGGTTVASSLAVCWAKQGLSVALIDCDDLNPDLTDWAKVGTAQRRATADMLVEGEVPRYRLNELLHPAEGFDGKLVVVGQPDHFQESFHFKADVLSNAASSVEFIQALIKTLREEFDAIIIDHGRSWGISTFGALPLSEYVVWVMDDDKHSVERSIANLMRISRESDDPEEFDFSRWRVLLNGVTGKTFSAEEIKSQLDDLEIFPNGAQVSEMAFSANGRHWTSPTNSFYALCDHAVRNAVDEFAFSLIPYRRNEAPTGVFKKFFRRLLAD